MNRTTVSLLLKEGTVRFGISFIRHLACTPLYHQRILIQQFFDRVKQVMGIQSPRGLLFGPAADIAQAVTFLDLQDMQGAVELSPGNVYDIYRGAPSFNEARPGVKEAHPPASAADRIVKAAAVGIVDDFSLYLGTVLEGEHVKLDDAER